MLFLHTDLSWALIQIWSWAGVLYWSSQSRATLPPPAWVLHPELRGGFGHGQVINADLGSAFLAEQNHCNRAEWLLTSNPKPFPSQHPDLSALLYVDG